MRDAVPLPADIKYASVSLTPSTSRNWSPSAPGTTPARHVAPPSVVTTYVPPTPLAQATRGLTGLIACSRFVVPLCCGVSVGADRKSTRLNSSHLGISYAVFCLKKKNDRETSE